MRIAGPPTPKTGPGSATGLSGHGRRRRMKKKAKRGAIVSSSSAPQDAAAHADDADFAFAWDESPKETATGGPTASTTNVVTTTKKKKRSDRAILEDSSDSDNDDGIMHVEHGTGDLLLVASKSTTVTTTKGAKKASSKPNRPSILSTSSKGTVSSSSSNESGVAAAEPKNKKGLERRLSFSLPIKAPAKKKAPGTSTTTSTTSSSTVSTTTTKKKRKTPNPPVLTPKPTHTLASSSSKKRRPAVTIEKPAMKKSSSQKVATASASTSSMSVAVARTTTATAITTPSVSRPLPPPPPPKKRTNRFVVAFDSRFLDTPEGRESATELQEESHSFLDSLASRGAAPYLVASSIPKEKAVAKSQDQGAKPSRRRNAIAVQVCRGASGQTEASPRIEPAWIAPPVNINNKKNRKAVHVPHQLLANTSWKFFGEVVDGIIEEDAKTAAATGISPKNRRPLLDVMIIANDISFLCDTNEGSHTRAVSRFFEKFQAFFRDGTLQTIHIVVLKTGKIALARPKEDEKEEESDVEEDSTSVKPDDAELLKQQQKEDDLQARRSYEVSVANCIRAIQAELVKRSEADYKAHSSHDKPIQRVDISVSLTDATASPRLAFNLLRRSCLREIVASTMALSTSGSASNAVAKAPGTAPKHRIQLDLPETLDGTQCSVSFDVSYKLIPFSLDRPVVTNLFFQDLVELCSSKLEIVQLVPLSTVDASLLFGVPMSLRAGLEDDFDRFQEVMVLVRNLFGLLQMKSCGMLLRIAEQPMTVETTASDTDHHHQGVFHNPRRGQMFLLMAEECVGGAKAPPSTGVLYRYASAEELVLEAERPADTSMLPEEATSDYQAYVENALDVLDCNAVNPLYLDATMRPPAAKNIVTDEPLSPVLDTTDNWWNDEIGVGALKDSGTNDDAMSVDDDGPSIAFEYD